MEDAGKKRRRRSIRNLNRLSTNVLAPPGALLDSTSCEGRGPCYGSAWLEEGEDTNMDNLVKSFSQLVCAEARGSPQHVQERQEALGMSKDCSGETWDRLVSTGSARTRDDVLNLRGGQFDHTAPGRNNASGAISECCEDLSQQANLPSFLSDVDVDEWLFDKHKPNEINQGKVAFKGKSKRFSFTKSTSIETVGGPAFDGSFHKDFDSFEREDFRILHESIEKCRSHDTVSSSPGLSSAADKSEELCFLTPGNNSSETRSASCNSLNNDGITLDKLTPEGEEVGASLSDSCDSGGDEALNEAFMSNLCLSDTDSSLNSSNNLNRTFTIMPEAGARDSSAAADDVMVPHSHVLKSIGPDDSFSPSYPPHPLSQSRQGEGASPVRSMSETVLGSSPGSIIQQLSSKLLSLQVPNAGSGDQSSVTAGKPGQENQLGLESINMSNVRSTTECDGMNMKKSDGVSTKKSDGMSTKEACGMSTEISDGMSTKKSDGMSTKEACGMNTEKSDGMSTKTSDGMSTKKSDGTSTEKPDGMSTKKSDGTSTKKSDGTNTKKSDGMSTKKSDGMSTKKSDGMSTKKSNGMSTKKFDGMSTKKSDGTSIKKSDGVSAKKSDGTSTEKPEGMRIKKSDEMSAKKSDGMSTKKSEGKSTKKSDGMTSKKSNVLSVEKSDALSKSQDKITEQSSYELVNTGQTLPMACQNELVSEQQVLGCGLSKCAALATDAPVFGSEVGVSNSVLDGQLQPFVHQQQNSSQFLDGPEVALGPTPSQPDAEVDIPGDSLIPAASSVPQEPNLTSSSNGPRPSEGRGDKTHQQTKKKETEHEPQATRSEESVCTYLALAPAEVGETSRRKSLKAPDVKGSRKICSASSKPKKAKRRSMPAMKVSQACDYEQGSQSLKGNNNEESSNSIHQCNETLKLIISRRSTFGTYEVFPVENDNSNVSRNTVNSCAVSVQGPGVYENVIETKTASTVLTGEDLSVRAEETDIPTVTNPLAPTQNNLTAEEVSCGDYPDCDGGQKCTEEEGRNAVACVLQESQDDAQQKVSERKARRRSSRYFHPQEMDNFRQALAEEEEDSVSCKSADNNVDVSESAASPRPSAVCKSLDFDQNIRNNERNAPASGRSGNKKQRRGKNETKASFENVGSTERCNTSEEAVVKQKKKKRTSQKFILSSSDGENVEPVESKGSGSEPRSKEEACESASGNECTDDHGDGSTVFSTEDREEPVVPVKKKPARTTKKNRKSWDLYKGQTNENGETGHGRLRARKHVDYSVDSLSDEERVENLTNPVEASELSGYVPQCLSELSPDEDCIPQDLENLYRNKNYVPPTSRVWETIKEHPVDPKKPFNKQRFRRYLPFEDRVPLAKLKRREKKAQTLFSQQLVPWTPMTHEMCERKLMDLYLYLDSLSPQKTSL